MIPRRLLSAELMADWRKVAAFAKQQCVGRGCSHNHTHMQSVTESAVLIALQEQLPVTTTTSSSSTTTSTFDTFLRRVIITAGLHDVNDHKYQLASGKLGEQVATFVQKQFADPKEATACLNAIEAVSFSKEKKKGKKWFSAEKGGPLDAEWVHVRNVVSDADKLYALGVEGMTRCWIFGIELVHGGKAVGLPDGAVDEKNRIVSMEKVLPWMIARVVDHADEKLLHLKGEYFRTEMGLELSGPRHDDLEAMVNDWKQGRNLPTSLDAPLHW